MTWTELLDTPLTIGKDKIEVTFLKPPRNGEHFQKGEMVGYQTGIFGGGWSANGMRFSSSDMRFLKKPKVLVSYNIFQWYPKRKPFLDWADVDNCVFNIITNDVTI